MSRRRCLGAVGAGYVLGFRGQHAGIFGRLDNRLKSSNLKRETDTRELRV